MNEQQDTYLEGAAEVESNEEALRIENTQSGISQMVERLQSEERFNRKTTDIKVNYIQ